MHTLKRVLVVVAVVCLGQTTANGSIDLSNLNWSIQHLIDTSQSDFGVSQSVGPRDNRGLAISPDGRYLYAGYNNGPEVRQIDLTVADYVDAAVARVTGSRGKGIAVDDAGRVYLAEGTSIKVYSANLSTNLFNITGLTNSEGVAVTRVGGQLVVYAADRATGQLKKWALSESGGLITGSTQDMTFGGSGSVSVGTGPRSVEVDAAGRIWVTAKDSNQLFRVSADGLTVNSVAVGTPQDVAFDGDTVLVTRYTARTIARFDDDTLLSLGADLTVPWLTLKLDPDGQSSGGALSGLVVIPGKGVYVTNETGQTADEHSTYGRVDAQSGWLEGAYYTDLTHDDNDPILFAGNPIPEPAAVIIWSLLATFAITVGRRKRGAI